MLTLKWVGRRQVVIPRVPVIHLGHLQILHSFPVIPCHLELIPHLVPTPCRCSPVCHHIISILLDRHTVTLRGIPHVTHHKDITLTPGTLVLTGPLEYLLCTEHSLDQPPELLKFNIRLLPQLPQPLLRKLPQVEHPLRMFLQMDLPIQHRVLRLLNSQVLHRTLRPLVLRVDLKDPLQLTTHQVSTKDHPVPLVALRQHLDHMAQTDRDHRLVQCITTRQDIHKKI